MSKNSPISASDRWYQGEDKRLEWTCVDADGAAQNCTGFSVLWQLFTVQGGTEVLAKSGGDVSLFDSAGTNDGIRVQLADTDTISTGGAVVIAHGSYWYELWKTNEGDEQLLASGDAVLLPSRRRQETS